jgi:cytoskeletal protein CcmA (bactofilin family)
VWRSYYFSSDIFLVAKSAPPLPGNGLKRDTWRKKHREKSNGKIKRRRKMVTRQQRKNSVQFLLWVSLLLGSLCAFVAVRPLYATDFRGGDTIIVGENEVIDDDLFISGDVVTINGTVKGNLFATGTTVTINGHVEGSLFGAGRTIILNSPVDGSVYVGSYALTLGEGAQIGRNLNFGGFSLTAQPGSTIGRSLYGGGYQFLLSGAVADDVNVGSGALELNGTVGGDVRGSVGSPGEGSPSVYMPEFEGAVTPVDPGLRVREGATIGGDLNVELTTTTADQAQPAPFYSPANAQFRWAIGEVLALLIIGLLFLYLRPSLLHQAGGAVQHSLLASLGIGLLILVVVMIAVPVIIGLLVALAVVGGWLTLGQLVGDVVGLGMVTLVFGLGLFIFTAGMVTKIVVAYAGGRLLVQRLLTTEGLSAAQSTLALVLGLVIYIALRSIQFGIGGIIGFLVTLVGLGALYLAIGGTSRRTSVVVAEPQPAMPTTQPA